MCHRHFSFKLDLSVIKVSLVCLNVVIKGHHHLLPDVYWGFGTLMTCSVITWKRILVMESLFYFILVMESLYHVGFVGPVLVI